jgi:hypothetical protein
MSLTLLLFIFITIDCYSQDNTVELMNSEINEILSEIDTFPEIINYHVIIKHDTLNNYCVSILLSNRLGEKFFNRIGIYICRFYKFNNHNVYVYEEKKCDSYVPEGYLRQGKDQYSFSKESAFTDNNRIVKDYLVEKSDSTFNFKEVKVVDSFLPLLLHDSTLW